MALDTVTLENVLRDLALQAGKAVMEVYAQPDFEAKAKSDNSPVTEADLAADKLIAAGLAAAFPEIPAVTEEQAESHDQTGMELFFLVDPLDGTKEFVQRRGDFTINIALIEKGRPIAGVVYAPAKGRLFRTLGDGAVQETIDEACEPVAGTERAITVSTPDNEALVVVASKSHRDQATDDFIGKFKVADFKAAGSSLKFCLLASGEADFYPRLGRTMEWDTAAGHAVLLAAGGKVLRFDDQSDLVYGKPGYENPFFLALAEGVTL
ncbi:3'(2'),5'-bisphosphate nucleotidase CysQ [Rhodobacteraceae bacterium NNCM2]|nr:3'(2'),5'-bisphosphate nucleotidase CysQ [Coraliihabitans acroporae]